MQPDAVLAEIRRFDPSVPIDRARTPPSSWYLEPAILELERERVLRSGWQPVARLDQLEEPGQYVAGDLHGEPFAIVRGHDGVLRGLSNVCAHHAAVILGGEARSEQLVCPYHGWTYDLAGRLLRAPGAGGMRQLDRRASGLATLPITVLGELVLLCLDPEPAAFDPSPLPGSGSPFESQAGRLRFFARREYTIACNWKVVIDNYLDGGYHVGILHRGLAGSLDLASYTTEVYPRSVVQRVRADPEAGDARVGEGALYAWAHPGWMLNRYGPILDVNRVVPLDVRTTRVVFDFFVEADRAQDAKFLEASLEASDRIQQEDNEICERVQRGLASRAYDRGRYAPRFEAGAHRFHCLLAEQLGGNGES